MFPAEFLSELTNWLWHKWSNSGSSCWPWIKKVAVVISCQYNPFIFQISPGLTFFYIIRNRNFLLLSKFYSEWKHNTSECPILMNILCFQVCFSASQTYQNLFIFEKRGVYIMQKLDCRIPNWITFLELMSYFPRLSGDLKKYSPQETTRHYQFFNILFADTSSAKKRNK